MLTTVVDLYIFGAVVFWAYVLIVRAVLYRDHDDD